MSRGRRVAVTGPGTGTGRARAVPGPVEMAPDVLAAARRIRRAQLRRAVLALLLGALLLIGLPVLIRAAPALVATRLFGVPGGWLAVALLPYPLLAGLAWAQLVAAERAERPARAPGTGTDGG